MVNKGEPYQAQNLCSAVELDYDEPSILGDMEVGCLCTRGAECWVVIEGTSARWDDLKAESTIVRIWLYMSRTRLSCEAVRDIG